MTTLSDPTAYEGSGNVDVLFGFIPLNNYPGKRPQTVGGAKGDGTSGDDDDDDDTQMRAQRSRHMEAHESRHMRAHI